MKCHECISFGDLGSCRNGRSGRKDVGYFDNACAYGEPKDKNKNQIIMNEKETTTAPATQVCKDCGRELPLEEFQKGPHGYMNYCKECFKKRQKEGKIAEVRKALAEQKSPVNFKPEKPKTVGEAIVANDYYNLGDLPGILVAACRLEDAQIIDLVSDLCDELRERGSEINGNIYRKFEI